MDYAVRLLDVCDSDCRNVALLVGQGDLVAIHLGGEHASAHRLDGMRAVVVLDHLADRGRHRVRRHDVALQDRGKLFFVLRLEQRIDGAGRKFRKRFVCRGEHGERTLALQRFYQSRRLDGATSVV